LGRWPQNGRGRAVARPTKCTGRCVSTGSTRTQARGPGLGVETVIVRKWGEPMPPMYPVRDSSGLNRREFLKRAAATGIAIPSLAAILAACGSGAQTNVSTSQGAGGGAAKYGSGGIAGADYPLARQDAPVTWKI